MSVRCRTPFGHSGVRGAMLAAAGIQQGACLHVKRCRPLGNDRGSMDGHSLVGTESGETRGFSKERVPRLPVGRNRHPRKEYRYPPPHGGQLASGLCQGDFLV